MKRFYIIVIVVSLILILLSMFYSGWTHMPIDTALSRGENGWGFNFYAPDHRLLGRTEAFGKSELLSYFKSNSLGDARAALRAVAITALVLGLIGWCREKYFKKDA